MSFVTQVDEEGKKNWAVPQTGVGDKRGVKRKGNGAFCKARGMS